MNALLLFLASFIFAFTFEPAFAQVPKRIVVLSPALTETIFALGRGRHIVGVTEFSDYPPSAKEIAHVGSYAAPSIEKIVSLKPDAVFAAEEGFDTVSESLKKANIPFQIFKMKTLADYEVVLSQLGEILDSKIPAQKLMASWNKSWKKLDKAQSKHSVLIQVDHDPIYVAGAHTFLSEIVEKCGGTNDFSSEVGYKQPSLEKLANTKADTILVTAQAKQASFKKTVQAFWDKQPLNPKPRVLFFNPDLISRLSPRLAAAALELCNALKTSDIKSDTK